MHTLVHGLLARRLLARAFEAQGQARGTLTRHLQARAHPVGPGRAVRQHRPRIRRQEPRVEGSEAVADRCVQPTGRSAPIVLRQARGGLSGPQTVHPLDATPQVGESVSDRPRPEAPGSTRTVPEAPHSS